MFMIQNVLRFVAAAVLLLVLGGFAASFASAQGTWVGECTAAKPCAAYADPPAVQPGAPALTTCTLNGLPGGAQAKPIIPKAQVPAAVVAKATGMKDPTCYWGDLVFPGGSYNLTATVQDAGGRSSAATDPPLSVTILLPLGPPAGLHLLQQ
jgi:hypothetical protein